MPEFQYQALDQGGGEVAGTIAAETRAAALAWVKGQSLLPLKLELAAETARGAAAPGQQVERQPGFALFPPRVRGTDLAIFTRQLASLFNAGLNMARCLDTLIEHSENRALRGIMAEVRRAVQGGSALWESLAEHPRVFSELYVNLVRAGESSGQLGKVLERLADSLETQEEYRSRIRSAMAYPILLLIAGFGAVVFILVFLVPRFSAIFASLNRELPTPTKVLLQIQGFVSQQGWLVLLAGALIYASVRQWDRTEQGGFVLDQMRMRLWLVGPLVKKDAISRFCRTMATLVQGGVPILTSFEVAERAVGNRVLRHAIRQVRAAVREGESLALPLRRSGVFPGLVTNMVAVGEETGTLHEMLNRVADAYDAEIANRMRQLIALVEPFVILFMGVVIGSIVLSMLIPVLDLSTGLR